MVNGSGASEDYVVCCFVIYLEVAINAVHESKMDWEEGTA